MLSKRSEANAEVGIHTDRVVDFNYNSLCNVKRSEKIRSPFQCLTLFVFVHVPVKNESIKWIGTHRFSREMRITAILWDVGLSFSLASCLVFLLEHLRREPDIRPGEESFRKSVNRGSKLGSCKKKGNERRRTKMEKARNSPFRQRN